MILVFGLSPAWQQIVELDALDLGEVNRARRVTWCASGKAINVGIALSCLGSAVTTISPAGGATGELLRRDLTELGVPCSWIDVAAPTRVCTTILTGGHAATELVENAAPLSTAELDAAEQRFRELAPQAELVVLTGSLPAGAPSDYYRRLMESAPHARFVLDIRGRELIELLPQGPLLVKPNRQELAATVGRNLSSAKEIVAAMREIVARGAQWVATSDGRSALWLVSADSVDRFEPVEIATVNPIGCGDCLTAGIASSLARGLHVREAVAIGIAAAAENARQLLPARLEPQRVLQLAAQVKRVREASFEGSDQ